MIVFWLGFLQYDIDFGKDLWLESQDPLLDSPVMSRKKSSKQKGEDDVS